MVGYSRLARVFKFVCKELGFFYHPSLPPLTYTVSFSGIKKVGGLVIMFSFYRGGRRKGKVKGKSLIFKKILTFSSGCEVWVVLLHSAAKILSPAQPHRVGHREVIEDIGVINEYFVSQPLE